MRKNVIAMSVAALVAGLGMAGGATAGVFQAAGSTATVEVVNPGGTGHQLLVPYYNVQAGNATLLNITNSDQVNGKAVKVRFRGASNSDDVFDFQLYLSPGDVWAANISIGQDNKAQLTTVDKSCTLPAGVGTGGPNSLFSTARLDQRISAALQAQQTREGYVEIFNMADIPPAAALFTAIKHVNGVPPCNGGGSAAQQTAAALLFSPSTGTLATDPADPSATFGMAAPTTGLFANFIMINVSKSGAASGEATSITANTAGGVPGGGNIVFFPQVPGAQATPDLFTADPALRTVFGPGATEVQNGAGLIYAPPSGAPAGAPIVAASPFDLPDLSTPYITGLGGTAASPIAQAEALTRSLATVAVINEYLTDTTIGANTDWVFSMPTRRYSVAADYRGTSATGRAFTKFVNRDYFTAANTTLSGNQICTATTGVTVFNREEGTAQGTNFVISPNPPVATFALCGEASVLAFNGSGSATAVLGAEIAKTDFPAAFRDGWANVGTPGVATGATPSAGGNGLPILGKAFIRAAPAANVGFFGASWEHRYLRPVTP